MLRGAPVRVCVCAFERSRTRPPRLARSLGAAARVSSFPQREQSLNWAILFGRTKQCMRAAGHPRSSSLSGRFIPVVPGEKALYYRNQSLLPNCLHFCLLPSPCVSCSNLRRQHRKLLLPHKDNSEDGGKKEQEQRGREQPSSPPSPSVSQAQARRRTISLSSLPSSQEPAPCFPSPSPPLLLGRSSSRDAFSETQAAQTSEHLCEVE